MGRGKERPCLRGVRQIAEMNPAQPLPKSAEVDNNYIVIRNHKTKPTGSRLLKVARQLVVLFDAQYHLKEGNAWTSASHCAGQTLMTLKLSAFHCNCPNHIPSTSSYLKLVL